MTKFGTKDVYPAYLTIGNIPKDIRCKPSRRAYMLVAYLPNTKLKHISNLASRRRSLSNLFHSSMRRLLLPLETVGVKGMTFTGGDGVQRRGHPIFALFIGDYPEQVLVTGVKTGECPKCQVSRDNVGTGTTPLIIRDLKKVKTVLATADMLPLQYAAACRDACIKPIYHPFWENLPYSNVYESIVPDVLHQLHQGVIKHLVKWLAAAYGCAEVDARCQRMPPNHQIRIFKNGITSLTHLTGKEHDEMCRLLLGIIVGARIVSGHDSTRLLKAVRGLLDFVTISRFPIHTDASLQSLNIALQLFHENKAVFVDIGIRKNFKIPKLHFCRHYADAICLYGSTDNYDTQHTERLHIDYAKDAYRASNHRDELFQMTTWMERNEKIIQQECNISRQRTGHHISKPMNERLPLLQPIRRLTLTKRASRLAAPLDSIIKDYGATFIRDALARYIVQTTSPTLTPAQIEHQSLFIFLPFQKLPVYHRIKYRDEESHVIDTIHIQPPRKDKHGRAVMGRFDTALAKVSDGHDQNIRSKYLDTPASCTLILILL